MCALSDPIYYLEVTCPHCGAQETYNGNSPEIMDRAFMWLFKHAMASHKTENDDG